VYPFIRKGNTEQRISFAFLMHLIASDNDELHNLDQDEDETKRKTRTRMRWNDQGQDEAGNAGDAIHRQFLQQNYSCGHLGTNNKKAWLRTENTGIKHKKVNINGEGNKLPGRFATACFTLQLPEFFQPCPLG